MTEDDALEEIVTTFFLTATREITTKDEIVTRLRATLHALATAQRERDAKIADAAARSYAIKHAVDEGERDYLSGAETCACHIAAAIRERS